MGDSTENLTSRPFKRGDVIVLIILLAVIAALFFAVGAAKGEDKASFEVYLGDSLVLTGDFSTGALTVKSEENVQIIDESTVKIISEDGYNVLEIDWENASVKVTDTDCGRSKECTMMDFENGVIICAPHGLTVKATGEVPPPVVG